jgi:hypothetical protein
VFLGLILGAPCYCSDVGSCTVRKTPDPSCRDSGAGHVIVVRDIFVRDIFVRDRDGLPLDPKLRNQYGSPQPFCIFSVGPSTPMRISQRSVPFFTYCQSNLRPSSCQPARSKL